MDAGRFRDCHNEMMQPKKQVNEKSPCKCSICLHCNGQGSCSFIQTVAGVVVMNYYGMKITFFIKKQAGKIDNVDTAAISKSRQGFSTIKLLHANVHILLGV